MYQSSIRMSLAYFCRKIWSHTNNMDLHQLQRLFCTCTVCTVYCRAVALSKRGLLDRSTARYFYKWLKTCLHKTAGNLLENSKTLTAFPDTGTVLPATGTAVKMSLKIIACWIKGQLSSQLYSTWLNNGLGNGSILLLLCQLCHLQ